MKEDYKPPFNITSTIVTMVGEISELIGRITAIDEFSQSIRLKKINQLQTIQGSLVIEGNTLSIEQITAILEGKKVIAPPREVLEAKNAMNLIEMTIPDKPKSRLQKYRITAKGKAYLKELK